MTLTKGSYNSGEGLDHMTNGSRNDNHPQNRHPYLFYWLTAGFASIVIAIIGISVTHSSSGSVSTSGSSQSTPAYSGPPSAGTSYAPPGSASASTHTIKRQGTITLNNGYSVALYTDVPNWQINIGCGGDCELWYQDDLMPGYGGQIAPLAAGDSGTYEECSSTTAYEPQIQKDSVTKGLRACVMTQSGHFALIQIIDVMHDQNYSPTGIILKAIVWS